MDTERLEKICSTARRLFNQKGYPDTKMAEIAKEAEIAVGTLYSMFTGKESVLTFTILCALDKGCLYRDIPLPIKTIDTSVLKVNLERVFEEIRLVLQVTGEGGSIRKDFITLMGELYDVFADYMMSLDNIEKNGKILEELNSIYLPQKRWFWGEMGRLLKLYMEEGQIQPIQYVPAHVEFLIKTLSWWSVNVWNAFPDMDISPGVAKETFLGIIRRAYQVN